jgi:hypothetical protein
MQAQEKEAKLNADNRKKLEREKAMADPFNFNYIKPSVEEIFKNPSAVKSSGGAGPAKAPATKPADNQYSMYANLEEIMKSQSGKKK